MFSVPETIAVSEAATGSSATHAECPRISQAIPARAGTEGRPERSRWPRSPVGAIARSWPHGARGGQPVASYVLAAPPRVPGGPWRAEVAFTLADRPGAFLWRPGRARPRADFTSCAAAPRVPGRPVARGSGLHVHVLRGTHARSRPPCGARKWPSRWRRHPRPKVPPSITREKHMFVEKKHVLLAPVKPVTNALPSARIADTNPGNIIALE